MRNFTKIVALASILYFGSAYYMNAASIDVLKTFDLSFKNSISEDYQTGDCEFNATETMNLLKCSELTTEMLISLDKEGEIIKNHTANFGYYYNFSGEVCYWGEDAAWFIEYQTGDTFSIGNMAGVFQADGTCNIGFSYNGAAVMFNVSVELSEASSTPEPGGETVNVLKTYDLNFQNTITEDYETGDCGFNATETMNLLGCSSLTTDMLISLDTNGKVIKKHTANLGYYYNFYGEVCNWGEDAAWFIEYENGSDFSIGNMAGVYEAQGSCNIGFIYNGNAVMFNVNITLKDGEGNQNGGNTNPGDNPSESEKVKVLKTIELSFENTVSEAYETGTLTFDEKEVLTLLGCTELTPEMLVSLQENGEAYPFVAGQPLCANAGFWYDSEGQLCNWGEDAAWFIEFWGDSEFTIGNMDGVYNAEGLCNIGFAFEENAVIFEIKVKLIEGNNGVESFLKDNNSIYHVYNLQGVKILETTDLSILKTIKGLYIVNGKKILIK